MPTVRELDIQLQNRPGTLGKVCKALSEQKVNILALQASADENNSHVRLIVDNISAAKNVLGAEGLSHRENEVAQIHLPNRPGELARAASRLAEANININYAYGGVDPNSNAPTLFFGVDEVGRAAKLLDQAVGAAASGRS